MYDMNAFSQLPSYGGMAGPSGFAGGQFQGFGQGMGGMFGSPGQMPQMDGQSHNKFKPWMLLSPLLGAFASGHPNIGLGMISPGLGIARALGAFK